MTLPLTFEDLRASFPEVEPGAWERLEGYAALLAGPARMAGLVGFGPAEAAGQIGRSLLLLDAVGAGPVVDVGSGAGLPGIALACVLGDVTLLEPRRRAVAFLELVVRELGLRASAVSQTAEAAGRGSMRETAGAVVARLLGPPAVAAELTAPLCTPGGVVVLSARPGAPAPGLSEETLSVLGLGAPRTVALSRSGELSVRVHMMSKVSQTAPGYPRRPGIPRRRPLA